MTDNQAHHIDAALCIDAEALGAMLAEQREFDCCALPALAALRYELMEYVDDPLDYSAPLNRAILREANRQGSDTWTIIEAMRAPSLELLDAAALLGLDIGQWIDGNQAMLSRAERLFPDHSPLAVGYVILSAGVAVARSEYEVKLMKAPHLANLRAHGTGAAHTLNTCWPHGAVLAHAQLYSLLAAEQAGMKPQEDIEDET